MATTSDRPTREQIVLAAARLVRRQGYAASSMRDIVEEADAPWGSLHYYFPHGKEQIVVEAVELGAEQVRELIEGSFARTGGAEAAVRSLFGQTARVMQESDFQAGCPLATVALERASAGDAVSAACATAFARWKDAFAAGLRADGLSSRDARRLATVILTQYEGALMLARVQRSTEPLRTTATALRQLVADARSPACRAG